MTQKPKRQPEWSSAIQDLNAKLQQLAERITRLEELVWGLWWMPATRKTLQRPRLRLPQRTSLAPNPIPTAGSSTTDFIARIYNHAKKNLTHKCWPS
jgi:hypothetical protein